MNKVVVRALILLSGVATAAALVAFPAASAGSASAVVASEAGPNVVHK